MRRFESGLAAIFLPAAASARDVRGRMHSCLRSAQACWGDAVRDRQSIRRAARQPGRALPGFLRGLPPLSVHRRDLFPRPQRRGRRAPPAWANRGDSRPGRNSTTDGRKSCCAITGSWEEMGYESPRCRRTSMWRRRAASARGSSAIPRRPGSRREKSNRRRFRPTRSMPDRSGTMKSHAETVRPCLFSAHPADKMCLAR